MDDLGVDRVHGRRIKLFELSEWTWEEPKVAPFILLVAADASGGGTAKIARFAADAIRSGCGYVCAWGEECEVLHDVFDEEAHGVDRFVMSTWHSEESLANALYFALTNALPDEDEFPNAAEAAVVLAVEAPWIEEVRRLVADQDELARLCISEEE
jgi:hypothetical protein